MYIYLCIFIIAHHRKILIILLSCEYSKPYDSNRQSYNGLSLSVIWTVLSVIPKVGCHMRWSRWVKLGFYCHLFIPLFSAKLSEEICIHDDVIKWKHFPRYWPFVLGIHRGQWRGALMFSLICAWINAWVNNLEAGDLRRYRVHYHVTVM